MRLLRGILLTSLVLFAVGCSCRTKTVAPDGADGLPVAQADGVLRDINFAFDSDALSPTAISILDANAEWLKANPAAKVQVEGHCDERGTNEYNMVLGAKRARSAFEYLRSLGVEESRMSTISFGEELPIDPRSTEEAWAKNRRSHFSVSQ